jgi:predicted esterase
MSPRFEHSPLFDDVRAAHRSEHAPAQLRRRSQERFEAGAPGMHQRAVWRERWRLAWTLHWRSAAAVAAASVGAVLLWLLAHASGAGGIAAGDGVPAPESLSEEKLGAERAARTTSRSGRSDPARPCPRQPSDEARTEPTPRMTASLDGMTEHFLRVPVGDCPPLMRRYLERLPDLDERLLPAHALQARALAPVMILLHDTGLTPEQTRIETRWYFEALAREQDFLLIYAGAASVVSTAEPRIAMGSWQTDPGVDPEIDDGLYLERVLGDLASRGEIAGGNAVWLVGFGGGATLALTMAAEYPDLYTGVAAFEPARFDIAPPAALRGSRLERVLFATKSKPAEVSGTPLQGLAQRWALALGVRGRGPAQPPMRFSLQHKLGRFDLANDGGQGPSVRVLTFDRVLDLFPPPGAVDPTILAELRRRPGFVNGADQAWQYLTNGPAPP